MPWQPPVHSPLTARLLTGAVRDWLEEPEPAEALTDVLLQAYGSAQVVLTASGTHALQLAIRHALAQRGGTRVALPAFACFDLVTAALGADAEMVFYDLDPSSLDPDPGSFREAVAAPGVGAVVVAPLYGRVAPWAWILPAAREAGVVLVEDAAQGVGSSWEERPAGSLGDAGVLSFGRGKGWTGGGGGALLVRADGALEPVEAELAPPPSGLPLMGASAAQWLLGRPALYGLPSRIPWLSLGETVYHPPSPPAAINPFSASLALRTREAALEAADVRRSHARALLARLEDAAEGARAAAWDPRGSYLRLPIRLAEGLASVPDPESARRLGIMAGYPRPLPDLPASRRQGGGAPASFPGATTLARELVTLPTHGFLGEEDIRAVARLVRPCRPVLPVSTGGAA